MTINSEVYKYINSSNKQEKDLSKYIIGEFQRISKNKDKTIDDEKAISILKKLKKDYIENKEYYDNEEIEFVLKFIDKFTPKEVTEEEVRNYLKTIDFSTLNNKMQAIGMTKKYFKGNVNSELVKNIIEKEY